MERDIQFWPGRQSSHDLRGWYINWRDESGDILNCAGPFDTRTEAEEATKTDKLLYNR